MLRHFSNFLIALLVFGLVAQGVVWWIDQGSGLPPIGFYIAIGMVGLVIKIFTVLEHYIARHQL